MKRIIFKCQECCMKIEFPIDSQILDNIFPLRPWIPQLHCIECGWAVYIEIIDDDEKTVLPEGSKE